MACPTKEEYEKAMQNVVYLKESIARENSHRESLINELCTSQKVLESYRKILEEQKEIAEKYQIYQELSSHYE
jgi:hypothetical protein